MAINTVKLTAQVLLVLCVGAALVATYNAVQAAMNDDLGEMFLNMFFSTVDACSIYLLRTVIRSERQHEH